MLIVIYGLMSYVTEPIGLEKISRPGGKREICTSNILAAYKKTAPCFMYRTGREVMHLQVVDQAFLGRAR